jgi:hypothetical protein
LLKYGIVAVALIALGIGALLITMNHQDREHDRFLKNGRSINSFLSEYAHALNDAFIAQDADKIVDLYSESYCSPDRGRWSFQATAPEGDVEVFELQLDGTEAFEKPQLREELAEYLRGLSSVDDVKCKIDLIENLDNQRGAVLTVKYILDGQDRHARYFQDRFFYRWWLVNEADAGDFAWRIVRDELVEGVRVSGTRDGFVPLNLVSAGIDYKHERDPKLHPTASEPRPRFGVIQHAGPGVSAVDYDNDGRADLFFADGKRCRLYHNDGPGADGLPRFTDVTDAAGLGGLDQAVAGIFADVDNDGHKDLFVVRYLAPCRFFHNNGDGTFTDRTKEYGLVLNAPCMAACFLDYDQDGYADLYVAVYGDAFQDVPRLPFFAQNGGRNRLFRNIGGKRFQDVTDSSGTGDTGWSMAVVAGDFHGSGYPDLAVANDFGKKTLYRNNGDGTFTETTREAGVLDFSGGMGVAAGDFDDDGKLDLYFSNINSNQRWFGEDLTVNQYFRNVARSRWLFKDWDQYRTLHDLVGPAWRELGKQIGKGNSLFRNNGDGTFTEMKDSHTHRGGWSWGVAFFDMDNDTDLDIFVANGWISNSSKDDL